MMMAVLLGVVAAFSWSLHDIVARAFAARIGPFRMAALVMIAGGVLLLAQVLWSGVIWTATWPGLRDGLLLGFAYGIGVSGLFKAFSLGPISFVGPITAGYPVLVVLWGMAHGLSPTLLQWLAVAATISGAIIVGRSGSVDGGINAVEKGKLPVLLLFCAISALGYSASVVLGQNAAVSLGAVEAAFLSRSTAFVTVLPFLMSERRSAPLEKRHWLGIAAMGAFDVVGLIAINASGHFPGREFAAIGISAYGAIAVILAMLILKEKVSPGQWAGIAMITAGVATLSLSE